MKKTLIALLCASILLASGSLLASCAHVCSYGEWQVVTEPTCTNKGERQRMCTADGCGKKQTEEIAVDPAKHSLQPVEGQDADCTTDGTAAHKHCTLCGKNFDAQGTEITDTTIPKGHKLTPVAATAASLHVAGTLAYDECGVCHKKFETGTDKEITDIVVPAAHADYDADNFYCQTCGKYIILTAEQLAAFRDSVNGGNNYSGKTVVLDADIDLDNVEWNSINLFAGTFDGQNHVIKNLKITSGDSVGLFGNLWQCAATVCNFTIDGVSIQGGANVGAVVGLTASAKINNVRVCNAVITSNHYAGGLVGYGYCKIDGCAAENVTITCVPNLQTDGTYDNGDKVGGIVGYLCAGTVQGCSASNVSLKGYRDIGGIVGALVASDGVSTIAKDNVADKISITVDQVTNSYGGKDMNVGGIVGRRIDDANNPAVVETNRESEISYEYIVDNSSAQKALDSAKSNSVIKLEADEYDKLYVRQSRYVSVKTNEGSYPWYKRELTNLSILGEGTAVIKGLEFISGHVYSTDNSVTDPVTGNNQNYYSNIACKNLVFNGIKFMDYMEFNGWESTLFSVDGLEVSNCKLDMKDSAKASNTGTTAAIHIGSSDGERNLKNFKFDSCEFSNAFQGIYVVNVENMSVSNCKFDNITHNAIAMQSSPNGSVCGNVVIENNTFSNGADRVIRFNNIGETAVISVSDNVMANYCDDEGEILKTGIMASGAALVFENNTYGSITLNKQDITGSDVSIVIKNV